MSEVKLIPKNFDQKFLKLIEPLAQFLIGNQVHPHYITAFGFTVSIVAAVLFSEGQFLLAGIMIILAGISDILDGRLARETGRISKYGALMDSTIDRYSEVVIFLGIASYFKTVGSFTLIILAITGSFMVSYTRARAEGLGMECKIGIMQRPERMTFLALGAILGAIPFTDHFLMILALWLIAILGNFTVIQRIVYIRNQLKSLNPEKNLTSD